MQIEKYYDPDGQAHTVRTEYSFGQFVIYLDGEYYSAADDRSELCETVQELIKNNQFTTKRPKQKNTPPVPASKWAE